MWKRFVSVLRCPCCEGQLELKSFSKSRVPLRREYLDLAESRDILDDDFDVYAESGVLLCEPCRLRFPVVRGLPIMLPYTTAMHAAFAREWASHLEAEDRDYRFPTQQPVPGEQSVLRSFSTEWLAYEYDGVIWESSYQDHKARVLREIGPAIHCSRWFLEVGCGLGLATSVAQGLSRGDAVGIDLSLAALKAAHEFRCNPFMHFVQASVFALPLARNFFDVTYSRGVLHHTYSTHAAFQSVAQHCRDGGTFYLWLYGPGSIWSTPLRLVLYALEMATRPLVSRASDALPAKLLLGGMALGYMGFNRFRRFFTPEIQALTFARGVHAARDRFTPRFAHRHSSEEIISWFVSAGFKAVEVLNWREMPAAERDDFRRNVGTRAVRAA